MGTSPILPTTTVSIMPDQTVSPLYSRLCRSWLSRHPMVRVCLEQAYDDIVHLTSYGDARRDDDDASSTED
jgi:hypothetical protein